MRTAFKTALVVLTLVALATCSDALASTGGASAPATNPSASGTPTSKPKIHPSGIATWFGPGFYGSKTACGQTLTPAVVGVANRTLPCGTLIKVGYKGHSLTVPVLDRGPYAHHADWDLTAGAAQALGIAETVRISTAIVGTAPNTPALGAPAGAPASPLTALAGGASAS